MNLTEFAIKRSRVAIMLFVILALAGWFMFLNLSQDSMPPFTIRVATVVTKFEGAGPERVELLVTDKIEKRIQEVPEVKEINSQSRTGLSVVTVELKDEVAPEDLQSIWDLIRRKLNDVSLPEGVDWNLNDDGIGDVYGIILGLVSDGFVYSELFDYAEDIRNDLIKLEEAAKVEIGGAQEEQIFVEFDNAELSKYGLSSSALQQLIASTNILYSGGQINQENERIILEPTGNFNEIDDLKKTIIANGGPSDVLRLEDITEIRKGYASPQRSLVRVNGQAALSLSISLKDGANIDVLGQKIDQEIRRIKQDLPIGLDIVRLSSIDDFVSGEVDKFMNNLFQSICIVLLVMLIFLGLRSGLVIASLIPMVTLATLMFMGIIDMGLNQVTLAGLIMALGMMVDNAVVVAESIMVKMEEGLSRFDAAVQSCSELFVPLLISTLTTSVAFLSFYLAESVMGDIVGPLFIVISSALIFSWLLSLTMVALLSYLLIRVGDRSYTGVMGMFEKGFDLLSTQFDKLILFLRNQYSLLIDWSLGNRFLVLASVLGLFVGSLYCFRFIPFLFFPDSERNLITIDINLAEGTRIESTSKVVENIEDYLKERLWTVDRETNGVLSWSSYIGEGPESYDLGYQADEANSNYAHILVNTTNGGANGYVIQKIDSFAFNSFPEADVKVSRLGSGGGGTPIEIIVRGEDPNQLYAISDQAKALLKTIRGTKNIKDNWGPKIKKVVIDIDQIRAQRAGLTNQDVAVSLKTALSGIKTGSFRQGEDNFPIIMRDENFDEMTIERLESVNIYSQKSGASVPLIQVAQIRPEWQLAQIRRKDLYRTMIISSEIDENANAREITNEFLPKLEELAMNWPSGYSFELGGEDKDTAENMGAVAKYLPMCGMMIIVLLIIQFNSFRKMSMVVLTIPLGLIGVIFGLLLLDTYFGFMAFLGVISLAGIIINNAIVLLDRIEIEENIVGGRSKTAIAEAAKQRFRPILLTTFTTILGLIPLYLGGGIMWEPMAASIMIGLLFGTIITLIFIPITYSLLFGVK